MHLGVQACHKYWDLIATYIDQYHYIFTESSLDAEAGLYVQPFTILKDEDQYTQYISERRWEKMRSTFIKFTKVDIDTMRAIHPLFIMTAIQVGLLDDHQGAALDHRIWNHASTLGKEVKGIESPQEQVAILQSLDLKYMYLQLVRISKRMSSTRSSLYKMIKLYENQEIKKLQRLSFKSLGPDKEKLIHKRNPVMAKRLMDQHQKEPSFFSFGAGHLSGASGVLRSLKHAGAKIRPVYTL